MDISKTPKRQDDTSHAPAPQTEEHDTELTVFVAPPSSTIKSIFKDNSRSPPTEYQTAQ